MFIIYVVRHFFGFESGTDSSGDCRKWFRGHAISFGFDPFVAGYLNTSNMKLRPSSSLGAGLCSANSRESAVTETWLFKNVESVDGQPFQHHIRCPTSRETLS